MSKKEESVREKSLEWFFAKNEVEKNDLKSKHFSDTYIQYNNQFGFAFNFGQIEEMYIKENP